MSEPLSSIQGDAEELKGRLWAWMDDRDIPAAPRGEAREAMNALLDALDQLEDHQELK